MPTNETCDSDQLRFLKRVADSLPSMLAYWDRDLRCRYANLAYGQWFGVDAAGLVGTAIQDLLGPGLFAANEGFIRGALAGQTQVFERVVPGPSGTKRYSLAHYVPDIRDGSVHGFCVEVTDVSSLKANEKALRAEIAARQQALDQVRRVLAALGRAQRLGQLGSWEWEISSNVVIWSDELYRIFGLDAKRLPPDFADQGRLYTEASWQSLRQAVAQSLKVGTPYLIELEYRTPEGGTGWLEARGESVANELGEITELRGTFQVVTVRRALQRLQQEQDRVSVAAATHDALVRHVSVQIRTSLNGILGLGQLLRDSILENATTATELEWIDKLLGCAADIVTLVAEIEDHPVAEFAAARHTRPDQLQAIVHDHHEFLPVLAHELRNMLAPLVSRLQLLRTRSPLDQSALAHVQAMQRQALGMNLLVNEMLHTATHRENGETRLVRSRVDLVELVREAADNVAPSVEAARLGLSLRFPDSPVWVDVDAARLAQVLANVLNNAVKYTPSGGRIDVSVMRDTSEAVVTIADTGIGLSASSIDSIFDMFEQAEDAKVHARGGMGIGLAVTRRLMQAHGGRVIAHSPGPGLGSTFELRLPSPAPPAARTQQGA